MAWSRGGAPSGEILEPEVSACHRLDQDGIGPRWPSRLARDDQLHLDPTPAKLYRYAEADRILVITRVAPVQSRAPQRDGERVIFDDDARDEFSKRPGALRCRPRVEHRGDLLGAVEQVSDLIRRGTG